MEAERGRSGKKTIQNHIEAKKEIIGKICMVIEMTVLQWGNDYDN